MPLPSPRFSRNEAVTIAPVDAPVTARVTGVYWRPSLGYYTYLVQAPEPYGMEYTMSEPQLLAHNEAA